MSTREGCVNHLNGPSIQMNEQLAFGRGHHVTPQYKSAVYPRDIIQIKLFTKRQFMYQKIREGLSHLDDSRVSRLLGAPKQHKVLATTMDSTSTLT